MSATRTPTDDLVGQQPPRHEHRQRPSGPGPAEFDTQKTPGVRSDDEFLSRFGDAIDDRIAEVLDEMLDERNARRPHQRLPYAAGTFGLLLALAASVLLRHSALAVGTIWPSTATVCLAVAWTARTGRP